MGISLKELKKNRLTPAEKWVLETIEGCVPETKPNGNVYWYKVGTACLIQDFISGYLKVVNSFIWSYLRFGLKLNNDEIQDLLFNILYDYTDNGKLKIGYF